jgi:FkbM family methyltransferase
MVGGVPSDIAKWNLRRLRKEVGYRLPPAVWSRLRNDPIHDALQDLERSLRRAPTFLQIGSNDGLTTDPLHRFAAWRHWAGVTVEPLPSVFRRLQHNYRRQPQVRCLNVAVGAANGRIPFFYVTGSRAGDPHWADQIGSFDREHVLKHAPFIRDLGARVATTEVPTMTLQTLHEHVGRRTFDLLHVDAEGFDEQILQGVDPDALGLRALLFEHAHMSEEALAQLTARFSSVGFREAARTPMDVLLVRDPGRAEPATKSVSDA